MSSYFPAIPAATDDPSSSQSQIQTNFGSINTQFSIDHVPLTSGTNQGYHTKVTFSQVQADPALSSPITEAYTKTSSNATVNDRFNDLYYYQKNVTGTSNVIQITGGGVTAACWITFDGAAPVTTNSYNVASITRSSMGVYVVNFSRPFSSASYCVIPSFSAINVGYTTFIAAQSAASLTFRTYLNNALVDANPVNLVIFGILA